MWGFWKSVSASKMYSVVWQCVAKEVERKGWLASRSALYLSLVSHAVSSRKVARELGMAGRKKPVSPRRPQWDTNGKKNLRGRGAVLETLGGC